MECQKGRVMFSRPVYLCNMNGPIIVLTLLLQLPPSAVIASPALPGVAISQLEQ